VTSSLSYHLYSEKDRTNHNQFFGSYPIQALFGGFATVLASEFSDRFPAMRAINQSAFYDILFDIVVNVISRLGARARPLVCHATNPPCPAYHVPLSHWLNVAKVSGICRVYL
jgi:hypothetical protein